MDEGKKQGDHCEKERKGLVQELKLGKHLHKDGKNDYNNSRFGLLNGNLRDKIVSF